MHDWFCPRKLCGGKIQAKEGVMNIPLPCATSVLSIIEQCLAFSKSNEGVLLFASLATVRVIFNYLWRSPMPEARDLALTLATTGLLMVLVISTKVPFSNLWQNHFVQCTGPSPKVTLNNKPINSTQIPLWLYSYFYDTCNVTSKSNRCRV